MKNKKKIFIITVIICLLIIFIPSYQSNAAITNGWKISGQNRYYYVNNKKSVGSKKIGKFYYYFDKKGRMVKDKIVKIKNNNYYYQPDGKRSTAKNVQMQIGDKYYYFNSKSQVNFYTGFIQIENKRYFFDSTGKSVTGWIICPVDLVANFTDEINGLYAGKTLLTFDTFYNNPDIIKNLETIIVPKVVKLDARQEYLLSKLSDQGINIIYM